MKFKLLLISFLAINLLPSVAVAEMSLSEKYEDLEMVHADDWREGDFDMAWSEVVIVEDDFDGQYLAVFDREKKSLFGAEQGIISEWTKKDVKVNFYNRVKQLFGGSRVNHGYAEKIALKVGDKVFRMESSNGVYPLTDEMIEAFANAPDEEVKMRVYPSENEDSEYFLELQEITIELDMETIDAWKILYGDREIASEK